MLLTLSRLNVRYERFNYLESKCGCNTAKNGEVKQDNRPGAAIILGPRRRSKPHTVLHVTPPGQRCNAGVLLL
jgi:hypothetical protein